MARRKGVVYTTHHLIPVSRGGGNERENKVLVPHDLRVAWRSVFGERLPEECLALLFTVWFEPGAVGRIQYSRGNGMIDVDPEISFYCCTTGRREAFKLLFPKPDEVREVLQLWLHRWVPARYFTALSVTIQGVEEDLPLPEPFPDLWFLLPWSGQTRRTLRAFSMRLKKRAKRFRFGNKRNPRIIFEQRRLKQQALEEQLREIELVDDLV